MSPPPRPSDSRAPSLRWRCVLRGSGAVARALGLALAELGAGVEFLSRSSARASGAARAVRARSSPTAAGRVRGGRDAASALERCDVLLLCVADRGLVESVSALAAAGPAPHARAVVLHTAGSRGVELLAPLARRGWSCGALHPLVPLPARDLAAARARLTGASYALEGEARALRVARELVRSLEGSVLRLQSGRRPRTRYHAAAALASGGLVALWDLALGELEAAGLERKQARRALHGLLAANLEHLERLEPERALTGPVARGDVELVSDHLGALSAPAREAYRVLGRRMLALAKAGGALPRGSFAQLGRLFED